MGGHGTSTNFHSCHHCGASKVLSLAFVFIFFYKCTLNYLRVDGGGNPQKCVEICVLGHQETPQWGKMRPFFVLVL